MEELFHQCQSRGRLINERYLPLQFLGKGGMGWVISARDSLLKEELVVLKFLYPHLVANENFLRRFKAEVLIARKLIHPHIVRTHSFCTDRELGHNIVMEHIDGSTLRARLENLERPPLTNDEALEILYHLALSIEHAHQIGVVHLDIKAENVLIDENGRTRLSDFGLAQSLRNDETRSSSLIGTPHYMAPEQFEAGVLDQRTDIYSFGILSYELFTGRLPFDGETIFALAEQHIQSPIPDIRQTQQDLSDGVQELIEKCCAKKKEDRFQSVSDILNHLRELRNDTPHKEAASVQYAQEIFISEPVHDRRNFWNNRWSKIVVGILLIFTFIKYGRTLTWIQAEIIDTTLRIERGTGVELNFVRFLFNFSVRNNDSLFKTFGQPGLIPLIRSGVDLNQVEPFSKRTILFLTIETPPNVKVLTEALEHGANPNLQDVEGRTPMFLLRGGASSAMLPILLRYGANVNVTDYLGETALFSAIRRKDIQFVRELLEANADTQIANVQGLTPFTLAKQIGDIRIERLMEASSAHQQRMR